MLDVGREPGHASRDARDGNDPARKRVLGSEHPYLSDREAGLVQRGTRCLVSGGKGGLSAVWGAAVLPFPEDELADWPLDPADLRPHYAKAAALLGVSGVADGLVKRFPFHAPPAPPLRPSLQAQAALAGWESNASALRAAGFEWGRARHAVRSSLCVYDGSCLTGCAPGAVWSAAQSVERLKTRPGFRYESGVRVLSIDESASGVRLRAARAGASRTDYEGDAAFLACGPLATARLVLGSRPAPATPLSLLAQPYFLLPVLLGRDVPGAPEEDLHTLAQLFLELEDDAVSKRLVHLQLYGHNEFIAEKADFLGPFRSRFEPRLLAVQGYLHSDEGSPISVTATGSGEDTVLSLTAGPKDKAKAAVARVKSALARRSEDLGFRALPLLDRLGRPGEGNHVGGVFPMRKSPGAWETDDLGRLGGKGRVHLVDSSVLPSLPASTFTYGVMANASRIAAEAA